MNGITLERPKGWKFVRPLDSWFVNSKDLSSFYHWHSGQFVRNSKKSSMRKYMKIWLDAMVTLKSWSTWFGKPKMLKNRSSVGSSNPELERDQSSAYHRHTGQVIRKSRNPSVRKSMKIWLDATMTWRVGGSALPNIKADISFKRQTESTFRKGIVSVITGMLSTAFFRKPKTWIAVREPYSPGSDGQACCELTLRKSRTSWLSSAWIVSETSVQPFNKLQFETTNSKAIFPQGIFVPRTSGLWKRRTFWLSSA